MFDSEMYTSIINMKNLKKKSKAPTNTRLKNRNHPIIGQLNINSIRNKLNFLGSEISPCPLLVSETKLDDSFPTAQFLMSGFCKQYRLDRCSDLGCLLLYIREYTPFRLLTEYKPHENVECLFVEINIRKKKMASLLLI